MRVFITNNYRYISIVLVATIVILAFYAGLLYGKETSGGGVVLSCQKDVLDKLSIPFGSINNATNKTEEVLISQGGQYFGSKNGTKYYTPGCTAGDRIKSENIIWFDNTEDATLQGYSPASC